MLAAVAGRDGSSSCRRVVAVSFFPLELHPVGPLVDQRLVDQVGLGGPLNSEVFAYVVPTPPSPDVRVVSTVPGSHSLVFVKSAR